MPPPIISIRDAHKRFGATCALSGINIDLQVGSIHAIIGENGAGKSTLMKALAGVHKLSEGSIDYKGERINWQDARAARSAGISIVFQEFTLIPELSILENLILEESQETVKPLSRKKYYTQVKAQLEAVGLDIDPNLPVSALSVSELQLVEISKGISADADVFILDEPTAALPDKDARNLITLVMSLRDQGKSVFYISHRLAEILEIADDVSVIKDGKSVTTMPTSQLDEQKMIKLMVGRDLNELFPPKSSAPKSEVVFSAENIESANRANRASLEFHRGKILGLAGLEGQGQIELIRELFGANPIQSGTINGKAITSANWSISHAIASGLGFIPEDRKRDGLFLNLSVRHNVIAPIYAEGSFLSTTKNQDATLKNFTSKLGVRMSGLDQDADALSGGNQQKLLLARWLANGCKILLCEEITRGVDIGARGDIYLEVRNFAEAGGSVLVSSRDVMELIGISDQIAVMKDGGIVTLIDAKSATEDQVMAYAFKGKDAA